VLRPYVHRAIVVEEVERKRQHPALALELQVERRRAAERRQQGVARERTWREVDEPLGELEWFRPLIAVETEDEVRLHVRHVLQDQPDVLGDPLYFLDTLAAGGLRLVTELVPRLHSRQQGLEPVALEPLQVGLGK